MSTIVRVTQKCALTCKFYTHRKSHSSCNQMFSRQMYCIHLLLFSKKLSDERKESDEKAISWPLSASYQPVKHTFIILTALWPHMKYSHCLVYMYSTEYYTRIYIIYIWTVSTFFHAFMSQTVLHFICSNRRFETNCDKLSAGHFSDPF